MLAEKATAAGNDERNHHAVADLQVGNGPAGILDDPHELMAKNITRLGLRDLAPIKV